MSADYNVIRDLLRGMSAPQLAGALALLDHVSRPLTARELERALCQTDLPQRQRKAVVAALRPLAIIAVVPQP